MNRVYGPHWPWLLALYLALAITCGYQSWSRVVVDKDGVWTNQTSVDTLVSTLSNQPIGTAKWAIVRSRVLLPLLMVDANNGFDRDSAANKVYGYESTLPDTDDELLPLVRAVDK